MIGVLIPLLLSCTLYIMHACMHRKSLQTCPTFVTLWTVACQAPLSMRFSRQEYWKWVAMPTSRGSFWPRDQICSSCGSHIAGRLFTAEPLKKPHYVYIMRHMFNSVSSLSHVTLCDPMDCSTSGLLVHRQLPGLAQTHVHWVSDAIQPSHPLSSPSPPTINLSQHQGLFKWVSSLHQVTKVLEFQFHISPSSEYSGLIWSFFSLFS